MSATDITECFQCGARYNTADMPVGKKLQCGRCKANLVVGKAMELVDHIVEEATLLGASDIHIEPMAEKLRIRYRVDGVLMTRMILQPDMMPRITSRIKLLSNADIAEKRLHQDGRFMILLGDVEIDLRMSSYVTVHGENIVLRILNKQAGLVKLENIGFPPRLKTRYEDMALESAAGVIVITGPTGSGKTTTLYASIDRLNSDEVKIITAEDPVEYQIDGIMQCSINEKIGLTFVETLRAIVRQDPDIVVLGEIRDQPSAETAIQAALTGHQVFTTFHTEDSVGALLRLMDMGIEPYLIASTVLCVLAQRLVRRVCVECKQETKPKRRPTELLGVKAADIAGYKFYKGAGCPVCANTGFKGRIGVYEMLFLDEAIKQAVLDHRPSYEIRDLAIKEAELMSMKECGIVRTLLGLTTFEEVLHQVPRSIAPRPPAELFKLTGEIDPKAAAMA